MFGLTGRSQGSESDPNQVQTVCWNTPKSLALYETLNVLCVPGHSGIPGNEGAEAMASVVSVTKLMSPEPSFQIPYLSMGKRLQEQDKFLNSIDMI